MKPIGKYFVSKRIYVYEVLAFFSATVVIWLNEFFDIPYFLLGAGATPINWRESILESLLIFFAGLLCVLLTRKLFKRMKYLEGILPVCASCKNIRDENQNWRPIEDYIRDRSDAEFSHGICPDCAQKLYPNYMKKDR